MVHDEVSISADVRARLGLAGTEAATASLWPIDCQSCGRPLGQDPVALAVDQLGPVGWASLHHQGCRASEWNDSGVIAVNPRYQTHRINRTNAATRLDQEMTVTDAIARRDALRQRHALYTAVADAASGPGMTRQMRSELHCVAALPVSELRTAADRHPG